MPYVNCPECGIRSFALAPWSAVGSCPCCEAPLSVPRSGVTPQLRDLPHLAKDTAIDKPRQGAVTPS